MRRWGRGRRVRLWRATINTTNALLNAFPMCGVPEGLGFGVMERKLFDIINRDTYRWNLFVVHGKSLYGWCETMNLQNVCAVKVEGLEMVLDIWKCFVMTATHDICIGSSLTAPHRHWLVIVCPNSFTHFYTCECVRVCVCKFCMQHHSSSNCGYAAVDGFMSNEWHKLQVDEPFPADTHRLLIFLRCSPPPPTSIWATNLWTAAQVKDVWFFLGGVFSFREKNDVWCEHKLWMCMQFTT